MNSEELYKVVSEIIVEHHMTRAEVLQFTARMMLNDVSALESVGVSLDGYLPLLLREMYALCLPVDSDDSPC
jgi:hypothetical protein